MADANPPIDPGVLEQCRQQLAAVTAERDRLLAALENICAVAFGGGADPVQARAIMLVSHVQKIACDALAQLQLPPA